MEFDEIMEKLEKLAEDVRATHSEVSYKQHLVLKEDLVQDLQLQNKKL